METIIITNKQDLDQLIRAAVSGAMAEFKHHPDRARDHPSSKLLTINEAISMLRVSRCSLYNLIKTNKIKSTKIGGRRFLSEAALATFLNNGQ